MNTSRDFVVLLFLDTRLLKVSRNRKNDQIPRKVIIYRDFVVFLFLNTFECGKCPEIGKRQNQLRTKNCSLQGAPNDLECGRGMTEYGKCPETGKRQNPLSDSKPLFTEATEPPLRCLDIIDFEILYEI